MRADGSAAHQLSLLAALSGGDPLRGVAPAEPPTTPRPRRRARARAGAPPTAARRRQRELPFARVGDALVAEPLRAAIERRLRASLGPAVALTITDNRRTMLSIRRDRGARRVRLHHMFAYAGIDVIEAVGRYLARGDRAASRLIDRYIAAHQDHIRPAARAAPRRLEPCGQVHDLAAIQHGLSEDYFGGLLALDITWGRFGTSRARRGSRTIRMGTYYIDDELIRIHPALDQAFVPRYFVQWVVYHEMLHHVVPMPLVNGRRVYHSAEFRARERLFAEYARARAWEDQHLRRLIGARRAAATP